MKFKVTINSRRGSNNYFVFAANADLAEAQAVLEHTGQYNSIQVSLASGKEIYL